MPVELNVGMFTNLLNTCNIELRLSVHRHNKINVTPNLLP